jgi:hypothetical protein
MAASDEMMRERFAAMTDGELARVLAEQDGWVLEALALAREEVARRPSATYRDVPGLAASSAPPARVEWGDVYAALLAVGAVGRPIAAVVVGADVTWLMMVQSVAFCVVAWGLRTRRAFAWWLNWVILLLAGVAFLNAGLVGAVIALAWVGANGRYFLRRRSLYIGSRLLA